MTYDWRTEPPPEITPEMRALEAPPHVREAMRKAQMAYRAANGKFPSNKNGADIYRPLVPYIDDVKTAADFVEWRERVAAARAARGR